LQLRSILQSRFPFFLLLLPAFIVLHIEKDYSRLISYSSCIKEILILFLAPVAIYAIAWLVFRSVIKANLFSLISLFVFFFFGDIKDLLSKTFPGSFFQSYTFLFPTTIILVTGAGILIRRSKPEADRLFRFVHLALLLFIVIDLTLIVLPYNQPTAPNTTPDIQFCGECPKPDIYFILLDEYTSSNNMQQQFGYDNSAIDNYLKSEGFSIIANSTSNYNLTAFSMSSIFSMNYLPTVDSSKDFYLKNYLPGVELMYETPLLSIFGTLGYTAYNNSIFNIKNYPSLTPLPDMWGIRQIFQQHNIFRKMDNEIGWQFPSWMHLRLTKEIPTPEAQDIRDSIAMKKLFSILHEKTGGPKFVYTHLLSPHFPFTRDSLGNKIATPFNAAAEQPEKDYISQVALTNRMIRKMVDSIKAYSLAPPVIIIQGDHGYRPATREISASQFRNFNAMYFPESMRPVINDSMSNVNTFRFVFNQLFNSRVPLLDNRHYFLKYWPL